VAVLAWVVLSGLLHGGYAHAYKDILFLVDGPPELYYPLNSDEHYPPDDIFFEITGVLEMVTAYFIALFTYRLIRGRQQSDHPQRKSERPWHDKGRSIRLTPQAVKALEGHRKTEDDERLKLGNVWKIYCCPTAANPPPSVLGVLTFLRDLQVKKRADERTRTADLISLRVCGQWLLGVAEVCNSRINKRLLCPSLA